METRKACGVGAWVTTALIVASGAAVGEPFEEELIGTDVSMDVRSLGMAGATVSRARGVDAVLTNPAGLAALYESELSASGVYSRTGVETRYSSWTTDDSRSDVRLGQMGLAYRSKSAPRLGFGFSVNQVRDLDRPFLIDATEIEGDFTGFSFVEDRQAHGTVYSYTLAAGLEVSPGVRLGAATDHWEARSDKLIRLDRRDVAQVDPTIDAVLVDDQVDRWADTTRLRVGFELGLVPEVTVGGAVVLGSDVDIRERWRQFTRLELDDGTIDRTLNPGSSGVIDYTLHLPPEFQGGVTVRVDRLRVSGAIRYVDWRDASYSRSPARDLSARQFATYYGDAAEVRGGVEWSFDHGVVLRGGVRVGSTPIDWKAVVRDPTVVSLGVTTPLAPGVRGDAAYIRTTWDREDNELSEKFASDQIVVGARLVF